MRSLPPHALWISGRLSFDVRKLHDAGVAAVVDLAMEEVPFELPRDFWYLRLPLVDGAGNAPTAIRFAVEATANLLEIGVGTLVVCSLGLSRAPVIAAAAISKYTNRDLHACLAQIGHGGPTDISPGLWNEVKAVLE